jgi:hypothetical protein
MISPIDDVKKLRPVPRSAIARQSINILTMDFLTSLHKINVKMVRQQPKIVRIDEARLIYVDLCIVVLKVD